MMHDCTDRHGLWAHVTYSEYQAARIIDAHAGSEPHQQLDWLPRLACIAQLPCHHLAVPAPQPAGAAAELRAAGACAGCEHWHPSLQASAVWQSPTGHLPAFPFA